MSEDPQISDAPSANYLNLDYSDRAAISILGTFEKYCSTSD